MSSTNKEKATKREDFVPWNYPPRPSVRARKLIEELNRLCREEFGYDGPAVEFRASFYFLDFCFIFPEINLKVAVELDDPHHDKQEYKEKDLRKDKYLKSNGWIVKRINYKDFDSKPTDQLAFDLLFEISLIKCEYERKGKLG